MFSISFNVKNSSPVHSAYHMSNHFAQNVEFLDYILNVYRVSQVFFRNHFIVVKRVLLCLRGRYYETFNYYLTTQKAIFQTLRFKQYTFKILKIDEV